MVDAITFIHSGDIHLGAPFRGLRGLSDRWADRLTNAIPEALSRVVDAAIERRVDFLLLAGDIFDTEKPSYAHHRVLITQLTRLQQAGIPVYMCAGNHDPFANWQGTFSELPANVTMLPSDKPGFAVHYRDGEPVAIIAGRGFCNIGRYASLNEGIDRQAALDACGFGDLPADQQPPFVVGMLHSGLWMDPYKAPADLDAMRRSGVDYWALGHIHMRWIDDEANPRVAYCGCIQGRDIKEEGDRGCYLVTIRKGCANRLEPIDTASVEWERIEVDVTGLPSVQAVENACIRRMFDVNTESHCEEMVVRLTLTGRTDLHGVLGDQATLRELRMSLNEGTPTFFVDAILDATAVCHDEDAIRVEGMFPAAVLAVRDSWARDPEDGAKRLEQAFLQRKVDAPANLSKDYERLCRQAQELVFDLLDQEGV